MKRILPIIFFFLASVFVLGQKSTVVLPIQKMQDFGLRLNNLPGFYQSSIQLSVTNPGMQNIKIFFTKDGNFPDLLSNELRNNITLDSTTALTFAVVKDHKLLDTIFCGTYFIGFTSSLPVTTLILPPSHLYDPASGIYSGGMKPDGTTFGNCWKNIEKPTFFEYYGEDQSQVIAQYCGLKIFGGMTRQNKEKSLRVIARKKYGKGKFKGLVFKDKQIKTFNSLVLRISGNDYLGTRFLDMMCSSLAKDLDIDYMAYQPSVLFVNGKYWGIHNVREKISDDYLATNHGADISKTDLLLANAFPKNGSAARYKKLLAFLENENPQSNYFIDSVNEMMDIKNYFNFIILQIHIVNVDSRGNIKFWRASNLDGKFRWIFYDGDLSFSSPNLNFLEKRLSSIQTDWYNPTWTTIILRKLLQNQELRKKFINQYCYLLSTVLSNDTIQSRISYFRNLLLPEIDRHLKRKDFNQSKKYWEANIQRLRKFSETRQYVSFDNLKSTLLLQNAYKLHIGSNIASPLFTLELANNKVPNFPFAGRFFKEIDLPLKVSYVHPEYRFTGWSNGEKSMSINYPGSSADSVNLDVKFEKTKKSTSFQKWKITGMKPGKKELNPWVLLLSEDNEEDAFKGYINFPGLKTEHKISWNSKQNKVVLTRDSVSWRKEHPSFNGSIFEIEELEVSAEQPECYLLDSCHEIVDNVKQASVPLLNNNSGFFLIRNGDALDFSVLEPKMENTRRTKTIPDMLLFVLAPLILFSLVFLIARRYYNLKNKKKISGENVN